MKNKQKLKLLIVIFLTACYPQEKIYSVEQFLDDDALRFNYYQKCKKGQYYKKEAICLNVYSAMEKIEEQKEEQKTELTFDEFLNYGFKGKPKKNITEKK